MIREGAWIRVSDGAFWWIDEHANWIKRRENADAVGLPELVWQHIADIPNDYGGENRKRILLVVMSEGFIRMRGHGDAVVFEFTADSETALRACRAVLGQIAGPLLRCRFNNVKSKESLEFSYEEYVNLTTGQHHG